MTVEFVGELSNPAAIVVRHSAKSSGVEFFTPNSYSQQLGLMFRPAGYLVSAHIHNEVERAITITQEVLLIRSGKCKVSLYQGNLVSHEIFLESGDVILLAHGGHSIEMITDCEILEVKQGPYLGALDKTFL